MKKITFQLSLERNYNVVVDQKTTQGMEYISAHVTEEKDDKPTFTQSFVKGTKIREIGKEILKKLIATENKLRQIFSEMDELGLG